MRSVDRKVGVGMTAREINALIKASEKCGLYVYAQVPESIVTGTFKRIVYAKTVNGVVKVATFANRYSRWEDLVDGRVYAQ